MTRNSHAPQTLFEQRLNLHAQFTLGMGEGVNDADLGVELPQNSPVVHGGDEVQNGDSLPLQLHRSVALI